MFNTASVSSPDGGRGRLGEGKVQSLSVLGGSLDDQAPRSAFGARLPVLLDELTDALTA
jgi:hypothetical protein